MVGAMTLNKPFPWGLLTSASCIHSPNNPFAGDSRKTVFRQRFPSAQTQLCLRVKQHFTDASIFDQA